MTLRIKDDGLNPIPPKHLKVEIQADQPRLSLDNMRLGLEKMLFALEGFKAQDLEYYRGVVNGIDRVLVQVKKIVLKEVGARER